MSNTFLASLLIVIGLYLVIIGMRRRGNVLIAELMK